MVEALTNEVIVEVGCENGHTCAVISTGSMFMWRYIISADSAGIDDFPLPMLLQNLSKYVTCISANDHTASVTKYGVVPYLKSQVFLENALLFKPSPITG